MFRAPCAHHQEVKIVLYSLWYHHTETSEWSKITKIQFHKYEQIVVKFMCEFFGCDYCALLTINMLCHVEVMFIQLLNLLERYYVYLHLCSNKFASSVTCNADVSFSNNTDTIPILPTTFFWSSVTVCSTKPTVLQYKEIHNISLPDQVVTCIEPIYCRQTLVTLEHRQRIHYEL